VWPLLREKFLAHPLFRRVPLADAVDLARSLYRYLMPLALPLPPVDVAHSSAAGGLPRGAYAYNGSDDVGEPVAPGVGQRLRQPEPHPPERGSGRRSSCGGPTGYGHWRITQIGSTAGMAS
jgi:hypothetical protein